MDGQVNSIDTINAPVTPFDSDDADLLDLIARMEANEKQQLELNDDAAVVDTSNTGRSKSRRRQKLNRGNSVYSFGWSERSDDDQQSHLM